MHPVQIVNQSFRERRKNRGIRIQIYNPQTKAAMPSKSPKLPPPKSPQPSTRHLDPLLVAPLTLASWIAPQTARRTRGARLVGPRRRRRNRGRVSRRMRATKSWTCKTPPTTTKLIWRLWNPSRPRFRIIRMLGCRRSIGVSRR